MKSEGGDGEETIKEKRRGRWGRGKGDERTVRREGGKGS